MASISVAGDTSGSITISAPLVAGSGTLTLPAVTDTLVGLAATQTLTNKTLTTPNLGTPSTLVLTNATGLASAAMPAGSVLQVVYGSTTTAATTTSASFVATGLAASITPSSVSNKILILTSFYFGGATYSTSGTHVGLFRDSSQVSTDIVTGHDNANYSADVGQMASFEYLDSPSSTSSLSYNLKYLTEGSTAYFNQGTGGATWGGGTSSIALLEIKG